MLVGGPPRTLSPGHGGRPGRWRHHLLPLGPMGHGACLRRVGGMEDHHLHAADTSNNDHTFSEWRGNHLPVRTPEAARPADVGQCRRGAAERGRKGRGVLWAVGAGIRVACEPRATLRLHVHRLEASYGRCCLRVPSAALFVVFVASELQISSL